MEIQELAKQLQEEGIARGKAEAEKIKADARKDADEALAAAKRESEEILARARQEAEKLLENGRNSLHLASRDVLLKLRQELTSILQGILDHSAARSLQEPEVIRQLLTTLLESYARGDRQIAVELSPKIAENLKDWLVGSMKAQIFGHDRMVGFCVQEADGGKVEVTLDSVREALVPYLRGVVKEIAVQEKS